MITTYRLARYTLFQIFVLPIVCIPDIRGILTSFDFNDIADFQQ